MKEGEVVSHYSHGLGWTACGTRVLLDDIKEGIIPIKEARRRCQEWLRESRENIER